MNLNALLRFISLWARPPKRVEVSLDGVDWAAMSEMSPVFVLSTGRCGTKWLTEVLKRDPCMRVNHNDYPELIRHSRLAYESYEREPRLFQEIIRAARDGYILDAARRRQTYVETNNRITFFSHAIREVYPNARFVHLVRHPGDFVRSGLRRGWYHGALHDEGRIRMSDASCWNKMTDIEKIAWLWNETNQYIENFLATLDTSDTYLRVKVEEMFSDVEVGVGICELVGARVKRRVIASMLDKKINRQWTGSMPPYEQWSAEEKEQLLRYVPLAERYGYEA